jgi:tetratricopeptide (TPR) repeat protein
MSRERHLIWIKMKRTARPVPTATTQPAGQEPTALPGWAAFTGFLALAFVIYFPVLHGELLWDDAGHVTAPALQPWSGLLRIWFEPGATQQYYPLLHSAFWLEHALWGDATLGYHLINVVWHALSACLLVAVLRRLSVPGAWVAGLLFVVHPVCVESVAWIAEQKNTLSLVFYLAATLAWLRFDERRRPADYAIALLWFAAAVLTKSVTATLPAALLVVTWWRCGRLSWRNDGLPLLPWFVLGIAGGLFTAHFERTAIGAQGTEFALSLADRLVLAGRVFWFYPSKLLWPVDLVFVYPRWTVDANVAWQWLFPAAGVALLAALVWRARRSRAELATALLFGGSLFPALGFFNVYPFVFSYVADHFQYLASLAIFAAAGAVFALVPRQPRRIAVGLIAGILAVLARNQAMEYRDDVTLYEATLRKNPDAWLAHHNLAIILNDRGQPAEALPHIERTLTLRPKYPEALNNLGNTLIALGRASEAVAPLELAIKQQPKYSAGHNTLGVALMALGREQEGRAQFESAVRLDPDYASAHRNLGLALLSARQLVDAARQFTRAVQLAPDDFQSQLQLGTVLAMQSRYAEALPHLEAALQLDENSADVHVRLAMTLRALGRTAESNEHYQEAVRLNPALAR